MCEVPDWSSFPFLVKRSPWPGAPGRGATPQAPSWLPAAPRVSAPVFYSLHWDVSTIKPAAVTVAASGGTF